MNDIIEQRICNNIEQLATYTDTIGMGVTRLPFSYQMNQAGSYIKKLMTDAGLAVREDASGAIIGRIDGDNPQKIIILSHYDSVRNGGAYDGIAGIVCGIEIAHSFRGIKLPYSIEIIATNDEEGARFGSGFFSSKAFVGMHNEKDLKETKDEEGISIWQAMSDYGLDPDKLQEAKWEAKHVLGVLEIHIEQGPVLVSNQCSLGIVTDIVGMRRRTVTMRGISGHAGTVPMNKRKDPVVAATAVISKIPFYAQRYQDTVATVGRISVAPNDVNTIANQVVFSLDIRSIDNDYVDQVDEEIMNTIMSSCDGTDIRYTTEITLEQKSTSLDGHIQKILYQVADDLGIRCMKMASGAGHDSLVLAPFYRTAMVFVPSEDGVSHCPQEYTKGIHLVNACRVSIEMIQRIMKEENEKEV